MTYKETSKRNGDFNYWDDKRIKAAFNDGNGTFADFKKYMENNRQYCKFEKVN